MTRIVMETAALADAIKKAEIVAPTTAGQAFDKAAGILMEIRPGSDTPVIIRTTDLNIYRIEWLDAVEAEGVEVFWRLPSRIFASVLAGLPIGSGVNVVLEDSVIEGMARQVVLKQGRTTAKFNLMRADYYPEWGIFDPSALTVVADLGGRISQVEWAAAKTEVPISGVHFDGVYASATDRVRLVRVPLEIPGLTERITVPGRLLSQLLKQTGDIRVGASGEQFLIMPDDTSQMRVVIYGLPFPNFDKPMSRTYPNSFKVRKSDILAIMGRASGFASDRDPIMQCIIGKKEFAVVMDNSEQGLFGDVIDLGTQCDHPRHKILFTPKNIVEPITNSPSEEVEIFYDIASALVPVRVDGGSGYVALAVPRKNMEAVPE